MRSVEALQRAYYDFPTTAEPIGRDALDKQDVDLEAPFAPKNWRAPKRCSRRGDGRRKAVVRSRQAVRHGTDRDRVLIAIAAADIASGRIARAAMRCVPI
jgi:hypothetical protein